MDFRGILRRILEVQESKNSFDGISQGIESEIKTELTKRIEKLAKEANQQKIEIFDQKEAMCLMWYECQICGGRERIWNSRPRVTPFEIDCVKCGSDSHHVDWNMDEFSPNHRPEKGDRIFVDMSVELWRDFQLKQINRYWNHEKFPFKDRYLTKEDALKEMMENFEWGQPVLIIV